MDEIKTLVKNSATKKLTLQMLQDEHNSVQYHSHMPFLEEHNGYRKGKLHCLIGPSSGGKSTLTRTLVYDALYGVNEKKNVGLYLSEESVREWLTEASFCKPLAHNLERVNIFSEIDSPRKTLGEILNMMSFFIDENKIDWFCLDNLTTLRLYESTKVATQSEFCLALKKLCADKDIPFIIVAHTKSDSSWASQRLLEMDDVRGSKTITNIAQFFYVMQPFYHDGKRRTFIRTVKHRGYNVKNLLHQAFYHSESKIFGKFEPVNFEVFKELFKGRERL